MRSFTLAALDAGQVRATNTTLDDLSPALQTARQRLDRAREQDVAAEYLAAQEIVYVGLLRRLEGLGSETSLLDTADDLELWLERAGYLEADIETFNEQLLQDVPGELSRRNWRIAGYAVGGTVLTGTVVWMLWWISKTWWVGR